MTQLGGLLLSLLVEVPIVVAGLRAGVRRNRPETPPLPRVLALALGATLMTHPLAWSTNETLANGGWPMLERLVLIELLVVLAEAAVFVVVARVSIVRAFAVAAIANAMSFGVGWWVAAL